MASQCQQIKKEYEDLKTLKSEFDLELRKAETEAGTPEEARQALKRAKELKAQLEQKRDDLAEKIDPYTVNLRKTLADQLNLDFVSNFSDGLALVKKDGKLYFIDKQGKEIFAERFDDAWNFSDGLARVEKDSKYYFIDKQGRKIFNK